MSLKIHWPSEDDDAVGDYLAEPHDDLQDLLERAESYDDQPVSKLGKTGKAQASDKKVTRDLNGANVDAAYQANDMRKGFYKYVLFMVTVTLVAGDALMGLYVKAQWTRGIDSGVMIAWFSANVVQMVGLAYIVARYLFGSSGGTEQPAPPSVDA